MAFLKPKPKPKVGAEAKAKVAAKTSDSNSANAANAAIQAAAAPGGATASAKPVKKKINLFPFLTDDPPGEKPLPNPEQEDKRHRGLVMRIRVQGYIVIILSVGFLVAAPLLQPTQIYYVRRIGEPIGNEKLLDPLPLPNLTTAAILSWSTTTVTELMTYNFANYNQRISMFADRFLPESWGLYVAALAQADTINKFKERQLVLTAAPAEPPVMASEGINEETQEYEWKVQVPVILRYSTNNNKGVNSRTIVMLTLVRVSTLDNPYGIAIKTWTAR
ncbi:MAG: DotI/IcmL family type IV secretion protein [Alphaproteobacteria bacterium]